MPRPLASEVDKWERRLRQEGLAPLDQRLCGRVIVRTQVITPQKQYLDEPDRLALALEAWLRGDTSGFDNAGCAMLRRLGRGRQGGVRWPRRRARILLRICVALAEGKTMVQAAAMTGADRDLAYDYLRPLSASLLAADAPLIDDDSDDDGTTGD